MDHKLASTLAKNMMFHDQNKNIDKRYPFLKKCIMKK